MSLLSEIRRRNVLRVAAAWLVFAWLTLQIVDVIAPILQLPAWMPRMLLVLLTIGFVIALVLSWVYEITAEGLKRTAVVAVDDSIAAETGRRLDRMVLVGLVVAMGVVAANRFWPREAERGSESVSGPTGIAFAETTRPETDSDPLSADALSAPAPRNSIAVLPFVDLSAERDQAYFGDGIAEELLNVLAQVDGLAVASRTSSFAFKDKAAAVPEIAASLGVAHIVEGSVRKAGTRLRITAQLIDVSSDRHLWSQTFDRELTDVFAIQDEIAHAIAEALRVTLGVNANAAAGTRDVAAYDLYLLGMFHWHQRTPDALNQALAIFQQATARDPSFARAEAGLAMTYGVMSGYADVDRDRTTREALAHARRAVQLDPDSYEAHTALGGVLGLNLFQFPEGVAEFSRAIKLNPKFATAHHWQGLLLTFQGELVAGEAALRTAHALDPASLPVQNALALNLSEQGRFDEALALGEALLQRAPNYRNALFDAFRSACQLGRAREFEGHLARYLSVIGEDPTLAPRIVAGILDPAQRGAAVALVEGFAPRHRQGGKAEQMMMLFALLRARAQTLDWLQAMGLDATLYRRSFEFLHGDPDFEAWRAGVEAKLRGNQP